MPGRIGGRASGSALPLCRSGVSLDLLQVQAVTQSSTTSEKKSVIQITTLTILYFYVFVCQNQSSQAAIFSIILRQSTDRCALEPCRVRLRSHRAEGEKSSRVSQRCTGKGSASTDPKCQIGEMDEMNEFFGHDIQVISDSRETHKSTILEENFKQPESIKCH